VSRPGRGATDELMFFFGYLGIFRWFLIMDKKSNCLLNKLKYGLDPE
jgi:hypothetical protein